MKWVTNSQARKKERKVLLSKCVCGINRIEFDWSGCRGQASYLHLGGLLRLEFSSQSLAEVSRDFREVADGTLLNEGLSVDQVAGDVRDETFACSFVQDIVPEGRSLAEVVLIASIVTVNLAWDFEGLLQVDSTLRWLGTYKELKISFEFKGNRDNFYRRTSWGNN